MQPVNGTILTESAIEIGGAGSKGRDCRQFKIWLGSWGQRRGYWRGFMHAQWVWRGEACAVRHKSDQPVVVFGMPAASTSAVAKLQLTHRIDALSAEVVKPMLLLVEAGTFVVRLPRPGV